jgi:2-polyprenyl-3-methyl-5-hydroxy-6-metoxy-1,4-benzoquinol methylase
VHSALSSPSRGSRTAASPPGQPLPCVLCGEPRSETLFAKNGFDLVRCPSCTLVRASPIPSPDQLAEIYETSYREGGYAVFAAAEEVRLAHARTRLRLVAPHAPAGPWLEAGCSSGAFLECATRSGIEIDGFDISPVAIDAAQERGLSAQTASAESFIPRRKYAYVCAFDVLEHVIDPGTFLERARSWLAPGGRLALTVPDIGSVHARIMGRRWYYYAPPLHLTYFDRKTVGRILEKHGFTPTVLRSAPKPLTLDYAIGQFETFNPTLHRVVSSLGRLVPAFVRRRELPLSTGEILVVATT